MIIILGLFGVMQNEDGELNLRDEIISNIPEENLGAIEEINDVCDIISAVFEANGLAEDDDKKAKMIYVSYLLGRENEEDFYENLSYCFLYTTERMNVYDLVSEMFAVYISYEDRDKMDELYGITPVRITETAETE